MLLVLWVLDSSLRDGSCYINKACTVLKLALIQDPGFAVISPDCKRKAEPDQRASSSFKAKACRSGWGNNTQQLVFLEVSRSCSPPPKTAISNKSKQTVLRHWSRKWIISRLIRKTKVQFVGVWSSFICLSYYIFPVGPTDLLLPLWELEHVLPRWINWAEPWMKTERQDFSGHLSLRSMTALSAQCLGSYHWN